MARLPPFFRRRRLPAEWERYRNRRPLAFGGGGSRSGGGGRRTRTWIGGWSAYELRLTLWSGLLIGLLMFQAMRMADPAAPLPGAVEIVGNAPDPYAEARRSRAVLDGQAGAPPGIEDRRKRAERSGGGAVRVIDGDTFIHGGQRIRIADIDTAEVAARCPEEARMAAAATRRLGQLLRAGPFELERSGRDEDRYGRKLRVVTRGGRSIGDQMVAEGLARTWTGRREPWC